MSARKALQIGCVTVSLALLVWLLTRVGWPTIEGALSKVGWVSALLLMGLALAESLFDSLALRAVTGPALSVGTALGVNAAGSLLNLVMPWESGEVLKGGLLNRAFGTSKAVSSTIIWNYVFKISRPIVSLTTALVAVILCRTVSNSTLFLVVVANLMAFIPYGALKLAFRWGVTERLVRLLRLVPFLRNSPARWVAVAHSIDQQVQSFSRERPIAYVQVLLLQVIARSTGWLSIFVGFEAVGMPYGMAEAMLIYATMNVAEYVITLLPARVGVGESTAFIIFQLYGLNGPLGLLLYTLLRIRTIVVNGLATPLAFIPRPSTSRGPLVRSDAVHLAK